jgi:tetratricopeptide (TPR) repeat protein
MALCPLQGEGYLNLADLSFLIGPRSPAKAQFVAQALRVRPFDGAALFAAGQEAIIDENWNTALQYWQASFQLGPYYQQQLLGLLTVQVPVEFLLEAFQPDADALGRMIAYYKRPEQEAQLRLLLQRYAEACERRARTREGAPAARDWKSVASAYRRLDRLGESVRCLGDALKCDPSDFDAHYGLGLGLFTLGSFSEAEEHLTWCLRSRPHDKNVRNLLDKTVDSRLRAGNAAAQRAEASSLR